MERHYTNGTEPDVLPHYSRCTGPCDQGRKLCPCPTACQAAEDVEDEFSEMRIITRMVVAIIIVLCIALVVSVLAGRPS